ncbi:hypothetical protein AKJ16_DCAP03902 [Drosera capensis]
MPPPGWCGPPPPLLPPPPPPRPRFIFIRNRISSCILYVFSIPVSNCCAAAVSLRVAAAAAAPLSDLPVCLDHPVDHFDGPE